MELVLSIKVLSLLIHRKRPNLLGVTISMHFSMYPLLFRPSFDTPAKWNISPYLGVGLIRHNNLKRSSFAFSYGVTGSYNLNERIALSATLGGTTAHGNF